MNVAATKRPVIRESMRIGGRKVDAEGVVPVHYPYTNEVIGTVPAGTRRTCGAGLRHRPQLQAEAHPL